jgi:hypothetical protein
VTGKGREGGREVIGVREERRGRSEEYVRGGKGQKERRWRM